MDEAATKVCLPNSSYLLPPSPFVRSREDFIESVKSCTDSSVLRYLGVHCHAHEVAAGEPEEADPRQTLARRLLSVLAVAVVLVAVIIGAHSDSANR